MASKLARGEVAHPARFALASISTLTLAVIGVLV